MSSLAVIPGEELLTRQVKLLPEFREIRGSKVTNPPCKSEYAIGEEVWFLLTFLQLCFRKWFHLQWWAVIKNTRLMADGFWEGKQNGEQLKVRAVVPACWFCTNSYSFKSPSKGCLKCAGCPGLHTLPVVWECPLLLSAAQNENPSVCV